MALYKPKHSHIWYIFIHTIVFDHKVISMHCHLIPSPPTMLPSVAAGISDAATELDLNVQQMSEIQHPGLP